MGPKDIIELIAASAAVITSAVAVIAYTRYLLERRARRRQLEEFLRWERSPTKQAFSVLELMAVLRMTEAQIMEAAFASERVRCPFPAYWNGPAESLLFRYEETDKDCRSCGSNSG
jgi:hypothetical protein